MKIIFFGSSDFSIPIAEKLLSSKHSLDLIVTVPPSKKGRGQKESKSIIAKWALSHSIPYIEPSELKQESLVSSLRSLLPDYFAVASYGKMIPDSWLAIPKKMPLNVHPSLLPEYRGAAPIARQILEGKKETGVTIAKITSRLDAGDILGKEIFSISDSDDSITLGKKLADLGGELLLEVIENIENGKSKPVPQDESKASYAHKLTKELGVIDWSLSADIIHNQIRALLPWPSAVTFWKKIKVKILKSEKLSKQAAGHPGTILSFDKNDSLTVQTGSGHLKILTVQPESSKVMNAYAFAIGHQLKAGDHLG